jgi:hypothetical protein
MWLASDVAIAKVAIEVASRPGEDRQAVGSEGSAASTQSRADRDIDIRDNVEV